MELSEINKLIEEIELQDCPECGGVGLLEEENHNSYTASCLDCGSRTVIIDFKSDDQRLDAAKRVANLWNEGRIISSARGE